MLKSMNNTNPEDQINRSIESLVQSRFNIPAKVTNRHHLQEVNYQSRTGRPAWTDVSRVDLELLNHSNRVIYVIQKSAFMDLEGVVRESSALNLFSHSLEEVDRKHIPYYYGKIDNHIIKEFIFGDSLDSILSLIQNRTESNIRDSQQDQPEQIKQEASKRLNFLEINYKNYFAAALKLATLLHSSSQLHLLRNPTDHWLQLEPYNVINDFKKYLSNIVGIESTEKLQEIDEICKLFGSTPLPYEMCRGTNEERFSLINGDFRQANILVTPPFEDTKEFIDRLETEIINSEEIFEGMKITDFNKSCIANPNIDIVDIFENSKLVPYEHTNLLDPLLESLVEYRVYYEQRKPKAFETNDIKRDLLNFAPIRLIRGASASKTNRISYLQTAFNVMDKLPIYKSISKRLSKLLVSQYPSLQ